MGEGHDRGDSTDVTLSVVVTAHAEGRLLRPTLRSVAAAIGVLVERSISCELVIILDNGTDDTLREAERWCEPGRLDVSVSLVRRSSGDAGESRNAGAENARGRYVAFCDGDDLISRNYLSAALDMLTEASDRLVVHPSTVISFGARSTSWKIPSSESVTYLDLIRHNLWPSSSVSHRSTYLEFPYRALARSGGFGPEDWLWNIETSIGNIPHRPAPDTVFFYRVREFGGVNNHHTHSILPRFDLDGLARALPVATEAEEAPVQPTARDRVRATVRRSYRLVRPAIRVATRPLSRATKEKIYAWGIRMYRGATKTQPVLLPPAMATALREAAELEPALSWTAYGFEGLSEWVAHRDGYAPLLVSLVDQLRGHSEAIVAVPWVGIGGADLVSLNYARALVEDERFGKKVSMLATYTPSRTLRHLIPEGVSFVQVPESFRELRPDLQRRLLAQVFLLISPGLVLSVNCFDVTNSLQLYGQQLASISRIYLTLFAFDRIGLGYPVNPITDDSQRAYLDDIVGLITDNTVTAAIVKEMLALEDDKVAVHHQPALDRVPALRTGTRAYNNRYFSAANPFKVVWPHRLDKEKRPDALIEIARRLRSEALPVELHVHGQQVLSDDGETLMKSLADAGVVYHGPYSGGLLALPTHDYHALLLTSESEGLPLVLVQSMLLGLPVISSAVGGVTDIVREGETGLLAQGPEDIDGFVTAIRTLMDSLDERRRLIHSAYDFAVAQHGWSTFARLVDTLG